MRILIQECLKASVTIDTKVVSSIERGEVLFVSFTNGDTQEIADRMLEKMLKLRIFEDENHKTNLTLENIKGNVLCISQFTLYADLTKGNRPSFQNSLRSEESQPLYDYFCEILKKRVPEAEFGVFGADMKVHLINDGPFTILLDSKEVLK